MEGQDRVSHIARVSDQTGCKPATSFRHMKVLPLSTRAFPDSCVLAFRGSALIWKALLMPMFEELAVQLSTTCDDCGAPPTCVRMGSNPPTGLDETGKIRSRTEWLGDLWDFVERGPESTVNFDRQSLLVLCTSCYFKRTPPRETERATGPLGSRNESARAKIRRHRTEAIASYGGACHKCGHAEITDLRLHLDPSLPADYWSGLHLDNWAEKYQHLADEGFPVGVCQIWCIACESDHPSNKRTRSKTSLRTQIVRGYGGMCVGCLHLANPATVWLVRKPGCEPLVHEGGRKLNTRAKYEALIRMGYPTGWSLVCPGCYTRGVRG